MICTKAIVLASFVVGSTRLALAACRGSVAGDPLQPRGHPVGGDAPDPHPLAAGGAAAPEPGVPGDGAGGVGAQAPYRNGCPPPPRAAPGWTWSETTTAPSCSTRDSSVASSTPERQHGGRPTVHHLTL